MTTAARTLDRARVNRDGRAEGIRPGAAQPDFLPEADSRRSIQMYLQSEALARERIRQQRDRAERRRLADELATARRWQRLAAFSARRAKRSQLRLRERSAELRLSS
jgi:hypothetical protein